MEFIIKFSREDILQAKSGQELSEAMINFWCETWGVIDQQPKQQQSETKQEPKQEQPKQEQSEPKQEPKQQQPKQYTAMDIKDIAEAKAKELGNSKKVKALMKKYGAIRVLDLKQDDYESFLKDLKELV